MQVIRIVHIHILEMNGDSYRLKGGRENASASSAPEQVGPYSSQGPLPTVPVVTPTPRSEPSPITPVVHLLFATVVCFAAALVRHP